MPILWFRSLRSRFRGFESPLKAIEERWFLCNRFRVIFCAHHLRQPGVPSLFLWGFKEGDWIARQGAGCLFAFVNVIIAAYRTVLGLVCCKKWCLSV